MDRLKSLNAVEKEHLVLDLAAGKRWKVLYCDRPLAEVHRADDHRGFVRSSLQVTVMNFEYMQ